MTDLLERAFAKAATLPEAEQGALAALILAEIESSSAGNTPLPARRMCWHDWPTKRWRSTGRVRHGTWTWSRGGD